MITDNKLYLSDRQKVTATGLATKCIDLRVETTIGERPFYAVLVSHGQATKKVQIAIITSDDENFANFTTLVTSGQVAVEGMTRGAIYAVTIPQLPLGMLKRYLGVKYIIDGVVDGTGTLDDLCTVLDKPALTADITTIPATIPAGVTMPDQADTYSVVITDALHEYKPWKFLDVALPWDPSTAPALTPSGSEGGSGSDVDTTNLMKTDFSNATGTLAVKNGGTGASTADAALTALGGRKLAKKDKINLASADDVEGILQTANGGTGSGS